MIKNTLNNKVYIGQSVSIKTRRRSHLSDLRNNRHRNDYLQKSFNKYGEENFIHEILIECKLDELDSLERLMIAIFDTTNDRFGYNLDSGGNKNRIRSEETRRKSSESLRGRKLSEDTKRKISIAKKGIRLSEETKRKMSIARKGDGSHWYGKKLSDTHREKISNSHMGKKISNETKRKISEGNKGKVASISEEHKEKLRKVNVGKILNEKTKEKISNYQTGRHLGEKNQNAKLTEDDVIKIKLLLKDGELNQSEIAKLFNVNSNTISRIKTGKRWGHVNI